MLTFSTFLSPFPGAPREDAEQNAAPPPLIKHAFLSFAGHFITWNLCIFRQALKMSK